MPQIMAERYVSEILLKFLEKEKSLRGRPNRLEVKVNLAIPSRRFCAILTPRRKEWFTGLLIAAGVDESAYAQKPLTKLTFKIA